MEEEVLTLQIGDLITLKDLKVESYLSAEGILWEDVNASAFTVSAMYMSLMHVLYV